MVKSLIIVESPTKAKTITKIVGKDFQVEASMGHIKELPKRRLGVNINNDFEPTYIVIPEKKHILKKLKDLADNTKKIFLATDPDREGEAISWHLFTELKRYNSSIYRLILHEITKEGVLEALKHPGLIDMRKVKSQQARRVLDRLVGYMISPILQVNLTKGLSAGRVQSVAVRLICEREEEIKKFQPKEYWSISIKLKNKKGQIIEAKLELAKEKEDIPNQAEAFKIKQKIEECKEFIIKEITQKEKKKNPTPPFTTSKLQQEAANKLGFTAKKTMLLAQQLYEGIELGEEGPVGLITYMRTDSVRVADSAKNKAKEFIESTYGKDYTPKELPEYKNKNRVQDAHEAIRPTNPYKTPDSIKTYLSQDQYKLYKLIWCKFIASQMTPATLQVTNCKIKADDKFSFKVSGSIVKFPGFMMVYEQEKETILPELKEGEGLNLVEVLPRQHFTQPPPRYNEASLVKALEEKGIGRPSTYAQIIETIKERGYVKKERRGSKAFIPTELGIIVNDILIKNFPDIMDIGFTAKMEDELDEIEQGKIEWLKVVKDFYLPFSKSLAKAKENIKAEAYRFREETDIVCPACGNKMLLRQSKFGKFLACSTFPQCKEKKQVEIINGEIKIKEPEYIPDEVCELCKGKLLIRESRFGKFIACSNYPRCKFKKVYNPNGKENNQDN